MNTLQAELLMPKGGEELRLLGDGTVQVTGYVRNPAPGQAIIAFLPIT